MPLFLLKTDDDGNLIREDINRNEDLIQLFKQNKEFNHHDDVGKVTRDLQKESRSRNTNKRFILSNTKTEHVKNRFRKKTQIIGKIINGFSNRLKKKRDKNVMRLYDKTFQIIQKEKNRRIRFEKEPFVVVKRGSNQNNRVCNSSTFLTEKDFFDQCFGFMNSRDDMFIVQKYVRGNGLKHTLVRGCYSIKEGQSFCYVLSNKEQMISQKKKACVKSNRFFVS